MERKRDYLFGSVLLACFFSLVLVFVHADPQDGQASVGQTGQYTTTAANSVTAQGGNVTNVNVTSDQSTGNWQGFWGNVSGSLRLGDGSNTLYDWSSVSFRAVYASPGNDITWTSVSNVTTQASLEGKDTDFGFNSSRPDSINQTMGGASCSTGEVLSNAAGVYTLNSSSENSSWQTCIGEDGGAVTDTVFGTDIVTTGATGYNGQNVQFQLIVPVNETGQLYYFYLEV